VGLLAVAAGVAWLCVLCLGGEAHGPGRVLRALAGGGAWIERYAIVGLRAPRAVLTALVGAALAQSGLLLQGVTGNSLADPGLLGVTAGGGLAVTLLMATFPRGGAVPPWLLPAASLAGAVGAATATLALTGALGRGHPARLLLVGIALGAAAGALGEVLAATVRSDLLSLVVAWHAGTFQGAGWPSVAVVAPALALVTAVALSMAPDLDVLALGDDAAVALGVAPSRVRVLATCLAALLAAACVAVAGALGFVGLFAPHIARRVVGARHRLLVPAAAAVGATAACAADVVAHRLVPGTVLPTGSVIAVVGVPWLIVTLARTSRT
jgi:iron complex transport system permease protein